MSEQILNFRQVALAGELDDSTNVIDLVDGSSLTNSGSFRLLVDAEIMLVQVVSGNTLTVVRGSEGTTAAAHSSGARGSVIVTAGALQQIIADATETLLSPVLVFDVTADSTQGTAQAHYAMTTGGTTQQPIGSGWSDGDTLYFTAAYTGAAGSPTTIDVSGAFGGLTGLTINGATTFVLDTDYKTVTMRYSTTLNMFIAF